MLNTVSYCVISETQRKLYENKKITRLIKVNKPCVYVEWTFFSLHIYKFIQINMTSIKLHIKCEFIHKMCGNSKKLHDKIEEVLKIDF